jgi:hypothetical protein
MICWGDGSTTSYEFDIEGQLITASYSKHPSTMKGIKPTGTFIILFNFTLCSSSTINSPFLARRPLPQIGLSNKESIQFLVDVSVLSTSVLDVSLLML